MDEWVVATGDYADNVDLIKVVTDAGYECFWSLCDENDVLTRYVKVAKRMGADVIVRITGDCPLIHPEIIDQVVGHLGPHDIVSNVFSRSHPKGYDTEVLYRDVLDRIDRLAVLERYREHVTLFAYDQHQLFLTSNVSTEEDDSEIRLCVDYAEDLAFIRKVYESIQDDILPWRDEIALVRGLYEQETDGVPGVSGFNPWRA